jgi:mannitol-1-phosphate 5-dehydrogenase
MNNPKKLVLFGAGKIGRSFIAQLFSCSAYSVVFVDVLKPLVDALNERKSYDLVIKGETNRIIKIENVRAILASETGKVIEELASADICAVSIGQQGLPLIFPLLAEGLQKRQQLFNGAPLDIIIAENMRNAANYFETELKKLLPESFSIQQKVGLVETSIGKMVPIMPKKIAEEDILLVYAEPYNTLIVDKRAFKNPIPEIEGLAPKNNMKAWVDCKLFIHNLGHAATAYLGYNYNPSFIFLYEALAVPEIYDEVKETMFQSAKLLLAKYPNEFTFEWLSAHIDDLLYRFQNKALGDTIFRVGCDLPRKLSSNDRLAGAINLAIELNLPFHKILHVLKTACLFRASDENGIMFPADIEFVSLFESGGITAVLKQICGFSETWIRDNTFLFVEQTREFEHRNQLK